MPPHSIHNPPTHIHIHIKTRTLQQALQLLLPPAAAAATTEAQPRHQRPDPHHIPNHPRCPFSPFPLRHRVCHLRPKLPGHVEEGDVVVRSLQPAVPVSAVSLGGGGDVGCWLIDSLVSRSIDRSIGRSSDRSGPTRGTGTHAHTDTPHMYVCTQLITPPTGRSAPSTLSPAPRPAAPPPTPRRRCHCLTTTMTTTPSRSVERLGDVWDWWVRQGLMHRSGGWLGCALCVGPSATPIAKSGRRPFFLGPHIFMIDKAPASTPDPDWAAKGRD